MFTFDYTVTTEDYIAFNKNHLECTKAGKSSLLRFRLMFVFLILFTLVIFLLAGADWILFAFEAIALSVAGIILWFSSKRMALSSIRKTVLKKRAPALFSPNGVLIFDEAAVTDKIAASEVKVAYSSIEQIITARTAVYFYFGPAQAIILPYHNFKNQQELDQFLKWIRSVFDESLFQASK